MAIFEESASAVVITLTFTAEPLLPCTLQGVGSRILRVKVRDRFGDYAIVGVVILHGIPGPVRRRCPSAELSRSWAGRPACDRESPCFAHRQSLAESG